MIKSLIIGASMGFMPQPDIKGDVTAHVYYEHVIFCAKGRLTRDPHVLEWDIRQPDNRARYMKAREALAKTPPDPRLL